MSGALYCIGLGDSLDGEEAIESPVLIVTRL
jgi:hypothetical protein